MKLLQYKAVAGGALAVACMVGGCRDHGVADPTVADLVLVSPTPSIETGSVITLVARAIDARGTPVSNAGTTWRSSNTGVVTVDVSGVATALAPGAATVTATLGGKQASTILNVILAPTTVVSCNGGARVIGMLVDAKLSTAIDPSLAIFQKDLCADGYTVVVRRSEPPAPPVLRAALRGLYEKSNRQLAGAIFIGDAPRAYQSVTLVSANPSIPSTIEEAISYQYYSDLDGTFAASPAYRSLGGHPYSFDLHSGAVDWEIWIGVLPLYQGSYAKTEDALIRYVAKNHAYRSGILRLPRAFLEVSEHLAPTTTDDDQQTMSDLRTGVYSWAPFSAASTAQIYFTSPAVGRTVSQGYDALSRGTADFFVGDAHGFWGAHGALTIDWAESHAIQTIFFWSNGCAVGNLDQASNFLTSALYARASSVLVAKGTTNNSGGMGNNRDGFFGANVAKAMAAGGSYGDAIRGHVNVPLASPWSGSREFHVGTAVMLGDPTLRLR